MQRKYIVTVIFLLALLFCLPTGIHAEGSYSTITASVPVSFFAPSRGTNDCAAVMETINDSPEPLLSLIEFNGSGTEEFNIDINEPGTYRYTVYQKPGTDGGIVYDDTVYSVIVFVTADSSKELKYAVTATASDTGRKPDTIEFTNNVQSNDGGGGSNGGSGNDDNKGGKNSSSTDDGGRNRGGSGKSTPLNKGEITTAEPNTEKTSESNTENISENNPDIEENSENNSEKDNNIEETNEPISEEDNEGITSADSGIGGSGSFTDKNDPSNPDKTDSDITIETTVKTGDSNRQELWIALMCASLAVIVLSSVLEKKKYNVKGAER